MLLTYSAECAAGGTSGHVEIDILVNTVAVAPTDGGADAFCSVNHTATGSDGFVRASITVQIQGFAGDNFVRINVGLNVATSMWFGDSALLVYD